MNHNGTRSYQFQLKYILCIRREMCSLDSGKVGEQGCVNTVWHFELRKGGKISLFSKRILSFEQRICSLELVKMILLLIFTITESFRRISGNSMFPNYYEIIQKDLGFIAIWWWVSNTKNMKRNDRSKEKKWIINFKKRKHCGLRSWL
jgi:hypothetical protein